jgi:Domain of unknown function (DUF4340)
MSDKKLTILGILAAVMVLWAIVQSRVSSQTSVEPKGPVYLIQGLDPADIGTIIIGKGKKAVTLKRTDSGFVVASKENYPAKTSEVNNLISKCLDIKTSEFVTDDPANQKDLEVTEDKARSLVKFMTPEPNSVILAGVVIGKSEQLGQGTYVRLLSRNPAMSNKVFLTPSAPWFGTEATSYLDQDLVTAKRDDIESVTVSSPSGKYVLEPKAGSQDVVLENLPAGKKLKNSDAQSVFTALTSLRFDDVSKNSSGLKFDDQYVCKLKDSTVYTLKLATKDGKTYATCSADFTDKTPVTKGSDVESKDKLKAKEAKLLARDNAEKFTTTHEGWVYEIADWKAKNLTKKLADLLEDMPKPKPKKAAAAASTTKPKEQKAAAAPTAAQPKQEKAIAPAGAVAPKQQTTATEPNAVKSDQTSTPKTTDPNATQTGS